MSMFAFEAESEFFGHIVTHATEEQPGRLPRVVHTAHCHECGEVPLHGDTHDEIERAFKDALYAHHIQVLAKRLESTERTARHPEGSELLGS